MRHISIIFTVFVLVVIGAICLTAGSFERQMAIAQEDMAVLDFVDPEAEYARLEQNLEKYRLVTSVPVKEIQRRRAMLQYWQGDYADLIEVARAAGQSEDPDATDPEMQVLAANALYRVAQRGPQDRPALLRNLDAAVRAYHEALRAGTERPDVAFNYELAVRMRQEIEAGKRKILTTGKPGDKTEPNMHGEPGEPPKEMQTKQFQIRIPMDSREIEEASTGPQRRRRG